MNNGGRASIDILRSFAPGTPLRQATELILRQGTGALILIGSGPKVDSVCSGGFRLDGAAFTAQRVAEVAKMDGGIVVDPETMHITRVNVHFMPDPTIPTFETGTRFRTAERLARDTGKAVLAISEERRASATVYIGDQTFELRSPASLVVQANQALNSLERLRRRVADAEHSLTRAEADDVATVRDVVVLLQRATYVDRVYEGLNRLLLELGEDGVLFEIQANDIVDGVRTVGDLVYRDYLPKGKRKTASYAKILSQLAMDDLQSGIRVSQDLGFGALDNSVRPRGLRILTGVPRLPEAVRAALLKHFDSYAELIAATVADLGRVEGVGRYRAHHIRSYLDRVEQLASPLGDT